MSDEINVQSIFGTTIVDESGQPFIVVEIHKLIWTLVNTFMDSPKDLVISPFQQGGVSKDQYNFVFEFKPGVFIDVPKVDGWDVAVERDLRGAIKCLYIAVVGKTVTVPPHGGQYRTDLTYTSAIQENENSSLIKVFLTTGKNVKLGDQEIPDQVFGPFHLNLVQPNTPTLSAPPIAVEFVGRRTLLNDGKTDNAFTLALTNMTLANIPLLPEVIGDADTAHTKFSVWFDVVQNVSDKDNAWALTTVDMLSTAPLPTTSSPADWNVRSDGSETRPVETGVSPGWIFTVNKPVVLEPQKPVHFFFTGIKTELDPGVTRMYFRFDNLASYSPAVLIAGLEKTPLQYGATQGKGLYISAGHPQGDKAPTINHDSGLYVHQFDNNPAAIFNGGNVGIGSDTPPVAKLQITDGTHAPNEAGTLMLGPGNLNDGVTLRLGCQSDYSWIQSHGLKPLAINPLVENNVGIKTAIPGSALSVAGGMAIGKSFAQLPNVIGDNELVVEGKIGIGLTTPGSSLSVDGGVAIGKSYAQKNTEVPESWLAVEGRVGIGTQLPDHELHVKSELGIRLSLEKNGGGQLFISNFPNDNTVQLVATGRDDTPGNHTSAQMMWVGGWASPHPALPRLILSATEVDIQGRTGIGGAADSQSMLAVHGDLTVNGSVLIGGSKWPLPYATEKLKIIRGVIWSVDTSNGLKYKTLGSGYSIKTDNNAGKWVITFDQAFSDMPAVVATPQYYQGEGEQGFNTCFLTYTNNAFITIRTGTMYYGKPAWNDFAFIAIGPV